MARGKFCHPWMSRVPDPYLVTTRVITCFATDYVNIARQSTLRRTRVGAHDERRERGLTTCRVGWEGRGGTKAPPRSRCWAALPDKQHRGLPSGR